MAPSPGSSVPGSSAPGRSAARGCAAAMSSGFVIVAELRIAASQSRLESHELPASRSSRRPWATTSTSPWATSTRAASPLRVTVNRVPTTRMSTAPAWTWNGGRPRRGATAKVALPCSRTMSTPWAGVPASTSVDCAAIVISASPKLTVVGAAAVATRDGRSLARGAPPPVGPAGQTAITAIAAAATSAPTARPRTSRGGRRRRGVLRPRAPAAALDPGRSRAAHRSRSTRAQVRSGRGSTGGRP